MKTTKKLPSQDRVFSFRYYWHGLPEILYYQIPAKIILFIMFSFAEGILGSIMNLTGIYSVSSGELPSLLRSWYGWAVLIAITILFTIYMALDIIILILLSRNILYDQKKKMKEIISTAIRVSRKFINFRGCLIGMYFAVIIPLNTAMIGLRLTKHSVPQFIYSVIRTNHLYMLAYVMLVFILDFIGIIHVFTFHGVLFDNYSLATSMHESRSLFFKNWKNVILSYLKFFGMFLLILVVGVVSIIVIPYYVSHWIMQAKFWYHYLIIMVVILGLIFIFLFTMIFIQAQAMCITRVYDECTLAGYQEEKFTTPVLFQKSFRFVISISLLASLLLGYVGAMIFDDLFPKEYATEVIAHRGGGDLSTENTVESIRAAIEAGASASEIDVQRTADGHYVIFHDNTLKRLCNDPRTIQELTLEEIKKLRIIAPDGHQVRIATLEEILNTAKDEIKLYIELKGPDMGILIGKRGQTLDSLQYICSLVVNREHREDYIRVKLDTEDYRKRREQTLRTLARNIAYRVKKSRKPVSLEPMNPYERRIIHAALQNDRFAATKSEGDEPFRHVVIYPKASPQRDWEDRGGREH